MYYRDNSEIKRQTKNWSSIYLWLKSDKNIYMKYLLKIQ